MPGQNSTTTVETPEEWRAIPGYEGLYEVSDMGRVRSLDRTEMVSAVGHRRAHERVRHGRTLRPTVYNNGYCYVSLSRDSKGEAVSVHRLVLRAFTGEPPPTMIACHNNGQRTDNRASNLRWGTYSDNAMDKNAHGTMLRGERHHRSKLTTGRVIEARKLYRQGVTGAALAERFGVSDTTMRQALRGETWAHVEGT